MNMNDYQLQASHTSGTPLECSLMGLAGEAGEVVDYMKKVLYHGHKLDKDKLVKELGDVLWYVSDIARLHGVLLSDVAEANLVKLAARYPKGFSKTASQQRACDMPPQPGDDKPVDPDKPYGVRWGQLFGRSGEAPQPAVNSAEFMGIFNTPPTPMESVTTEKILEASKKVTDACDCRECGPAGPIWCTVCLHNASCCTCKG